MKMRQVRGLNKKQELYLFIHFIASIRNIQNTFKGEIRQDKICGAVYILKGDTS